MANKRQKPNYSHIVPGILVLALMITLIGCSKKPAPTASTGESSEYPVLKLKLSTPSKEDTGKSYDCRLFIDLVKERSGGKITFDEYFNATLSLPTANLDAISTGIADIGTVVTLYHPSQLPLAQISYPMPFGPVDPQMIADIMTEISRKHPEFYAEYEKNQVKVLGYKGNEPYKVYTKKPVNTYTDLRGMKIAMAGVYYIPWFKAIGAATVTLPGSEFYQGLNSNVVEGNFVYDSFEYEYKLYEVSRYIYNVGMGTRNNDTLCINLNTWNKLDAKTQNLLQECATEVYKNFHAWENTRIAEWNKYLHDNGMIETMITDADKAAWAVAALSETDTIQLWIDDVTKLGYNGRELMYDYFKTAESLGWKWIFDIEKYAR